MSGTSRPEASPTAGRGHREVLGLFHDRERLEAVAYRLQSAGFNRADLSLAYDVDLDGVPDPGPREEVSTSSDARKLRTLKSGLAGAVAALAAAGIIAMTGGAAGRARGPKVRRCAQKDPTVSPKAMAATSATRAPTTPTMATSR